MRDGPISIKDARRPSPIIVRRTPPDSPRPSKNLDQRKSSLDSVLDDPGVADLFRPDTVPAARDGVHTKSHDPQGGGDIPNPFVVDIKKEPAEIQHPTMQHAIRTILIAGVKITFVMSYVGTMSFIYAFFGDKRAEARDELKLSEKILLEVFYGVSSGIANIPMAIVYVVNFPETMKKLLAGGVKDKIIAAAAFLMANASAVTSLAVSYQSVDYPFFPAGLKYFIVPFFAASTMLTGWDGAKSLFEDLTNKMICLVNARRKDYQPYDQLLSDFAIQGPRIAQLIARGDVIYNSNMLAEKFVGWFYDTCAEKKLSIGRNATEIVKHVAYEYMTPFIIGTSSFMVFAPLWLKATEHALNTLGQIPWAKDHFGAWFGHAENWGTASPAFTGFCAASRILFYMNSCLRLPGVLSNYAQKRDVGNGRQMVMDLLILALMYGSGSGVGELMKMYMTPISSMLNSTNATNPPFLPANFSANTTLSNSTASNPFAGFGGVAGQLFFANPMFRFLFVKLVVALAVLLATILTGNFINYRGMLHFLMNTWDAQKDTTMSSTRATFVYMFGMFKPLSPSVIESLNKVHASRAYYLLLLAYYMVHQTPETVMEKMPSSQSPQQAFQKRLDTVSGDAEKLLRSVVYNPSFLNMLRDEQNKRRASASENPLECPLNLNSGRFNYSELTG